MTFKVRRERSAQNAEDYKTAFASIVLQCIGRQDIASGLVRNEIEGVVYEVYQVVDGSMHEHEDNPEHVLRERDENDTGCDNSLEARTPKSNKKASNSKSKTSKAKPKAKPKSKTTLEKLKPMPTPKTRSGKATNTNIVKASETSSAGKPSPTKTCKQVYALLVEDLKAEGLAFEKEETLARRGEYAGGMTNIEKRTPKQGGACKLAINALDYPNTNQMVCITTHPLFALLGFY